MFRRLQQIFILTLAILAIIPASVFAQELMNDLKFFGSISDRSTGSEGSEKAADHILQEFQKIGLQVGTQEFLTPVPEVVFASLEADGQTFEIFPWGPNLVYLSMTPEEGLSGTLIYGGNGSFEALEGKAVAGNIVLLDMNSAGNWTNAAMLGARAVVYLGSPDSTRGDFQNKDTPTPVAFPRYWISSKPSKDLLKAAFNGRPATVRSNTRWRNKLVRNCYGLLKGKDPELQDELIILDAFYDASSHVLGIAPGADESLSVAMLIDTARQLAKAPPDRSVLFLATTGNGQSLAGMRQFIWSITARKKHLRRETKELTAQRERLDAIVKLLDEQDPFVAEDPAKQELILEALIEKAKDRADILTREIQSMPVRPELGSLDRIKDPRTYRRISWTSNLKDIPSEDHPLVRELLTEASPEAKARLEEIELRIKMSKSANQVRNIIDDHRPVLFLSLYLSSRSPFVGLVELGETYPVRENIRRVVRASRLVDIINTESAGLAAELGVQNIFTNNTDVGAMGEGKGYAAGGPSPCCDVVAIAGLPAVSLLTLDDRRPYWATPNDTLDRLDLPNVQNLQTILVPLLSKLFSHPNLHLATEKGIPGSASLEGQAKFIRQGELFPDQPAPGTIISVLQGSSVFRAMVYRDGTFFVPGLANSRIAIEKLIIEPYGLDPSTGRIAVAADKNKTGKINYRIKVKTDLASTNLTMFHCEQTDVYGAFNPQNLGYLTKVDLLDAATEATPIRYWYSRVDSRNTNAISILLEKGTRFKLIMSESLLNKELFLLNSTKDAPSGSGFLIGAPATIVLAPQQVVNDLQLLLGERLQNLFRHGIVNRHLEELYKDSSDALNRSREDILSGNYSDFWASIVSAWAKLDAIYKDIEKTQRDVLAGVMFFIALFVPFAYCMERYLFSFRSIYQQLAAFFVILVMTIFTIRALHPAFQLTYSPMVVIVAFFIVGLSLLVSWIIFTRFEREMADLHSQSAHKSSPHVRKWQSFGAGFSIGVSNLNRRKLRTGLTCVTLIILTFTVMSFTNVKSLHRTVRSLISKDTPYEGLLVRHQYRMPLPPLLFKDLQTRFSNEYFSVWPRGWLDPRHGSATHIGRIYSDVSRAPVEGVLGVGQHAPEYFRRIISHGRWLRDDEDNAMLVSMYMAERLGLNPKVDLDAPVRFMGSDFKIVGYFDDSLLESLKDLDQNALTPAYLEAVGDEELTEAEIEAMQSGEELIPVSDRYRHASARGTLLLPFHRSLELGGDLRAVSVMPLKSDQTISEAAESLSSWLAYPLFIGEEGTWYQSASNTVRYQGVANLAVPILIVVFITLNTMIGHVHERRREIGTYTSVGLAPTHVGFLFIVEALSLAVISTVIGYILAQLSAKYLGNSALFSQLTFNYSSLASVACMFLVFSVVFLAALYPARMAAEIAMPDVNRTWTLPAPQGDAILMNLPFLLKREEETGIIKFLYTYFASHQDAAHGAFTVDDTSLEVDTPEAGPGNVAPSPVCHLIRTSVWLAPFDFGIKQRLQLHCCPSEDNPGYLEIALMMFRLSGERSAWVRSNRNFIKALRKQMLLWRLLDPEAKAKYSLQD